MLAFSENVIEFASDGADGEGAERLAGDPVSGLLQPWDDHHKELRD